MYGTHIAQAGAAAGRGPRHDDPMHTYSTATKAWRAGEEKRQSTVVGIPSPEDGWAGPGDAARVRCAWGREEGGEHELAAA